MPALNQTEDSDFLSGSSLTLSLRNFYATQHTSEGTYLRERKNGVLEPRRQRTTFVQAGVLNFSSGYTQGPVGFGLDAAVFAAANLERGHGAVANGGDRVLVNGSGDAVADWSKMGIADIRVRFVDTEVKVGRFLTENPMLRYKDNRALPSTFDGFMLTNTTFDNVRLQAGSFDKVSPRTGAGSEQLTSTYGNRSIHGDRVSYVGLNAKVMPQLEASAFASRYENVWDQYYIGLTHRAGDTNTVAWKTAFNAYHTKDQGAQRLGYIDNDAASLAITATHLVHSITLAYQQVFGNEYFDFLWETSGDYLANSLYSDYSGPNEKSAQIRYDLNAVGYGIPGLTFSLWYAKGWDIDGTHYDGDRNGRATGYNVRGLNDLDHHEIAGMATYVVQSGPLKNAAVRGIVYHHQADAGQYDGNYDEFRLITTLPISIF